MKRCHDGRSREQRPLKSREHGASLAGSTYTSDAVVRAIEKDSRSDEASEEEERGEQFDAQDREFVRGAGEESRRECEEGHGDHAGPNTAEDEVVELAGTVELVGDHYEN